MVALKAIEAEATYQGIPCLAAEFTATPGLGSDEGSVVIAVRRPSALKIAIGSVLFADNPLVRSTTIPRRQIPDERPSAISVGDGIVEDGTLAPYGDLVLRSTVGTQTIRRLMPIAIEPIEQDDDGLVLYRIRLADVRTMWPHRGVLFGDFNHYDQLGQPIEHVPQRDLSFTMRRAAAALPGVMTTELASGAAKAAAAAELRGIEWRFASPAREHARHLEHADLHPVLQADGKTLRIYQRGEGKADPTALGIRPDYLHAVATPEVTYVPDSVLVVGAPRQREIRITLASDVYMVGLSVNGDELLPWKEALSTYGLTPFQAARWVLQKRETQVDMLNRARTAAPGQPQGEDTTAPRGALTGEDLARRLSAWLFRWFRLPDTLRHTLPMLDLLDERGREVPIRVHADTIVEDVDAEASTGRRWRTAWGVHVSAQQVQHDPDAGVIRIGWELPPGAIVSPEDPGPAAEVARYQARLVEQVRAIERILAEYADTTGYEDRLVQLRAEAKQLRVDLRTSIDQRRHVGLVVLEQGALLPTSIDVLYRSELKDGARRLGLPVDPTAPYASDPSDHFTLAFERKGTSLTEVGLGDLSSAPLVIHAPELVELVRASGANNVQELRRQAAGLAAAHFARPQVAVSYDVRAAGIHPVWPDGAVGQVRWRVSDSAAETQVVINSYRRSIDATAPTYAGKAATVARDLDRVRISEVDAARTAPQRRRRGSRA